MDNTYSNETYLQYILANCAAPVLAKKKPAGLMTVWKHHLHNFDMNEYIQTGALSYRNDSSMEILLETKLYYLLFCYQEERLVYELENIKNSDMLSEYTSLTKIQDKIDLLKEKMHTYWAIGSDFPHEVGLFLGYPVWDVKGFIEHKGQQYKLCGYWKVYDDVPGALCKFEEYDWIKKCALERFYKDLNRNNQKI
ncbi:MAG TPA: hypothetical protein DCW90_21655 [Lachnospiraceae bacterium]|nr:hypothetical protein [Lachnospiraceae bacterium]